MNKNKPAISNADFDLMKRIAKHGYVDMLYIYRFAYPGRKKRTVIDRVAQLTLHKYLYSYETFNPAEFTANARRSYKIVALGIEGIRLLKFSGIPVNDKQISLANNSPYRMYHQAQLATVCDSLSCAFEASETNKNYVDRIFNEKELANNDVLMQPDALLLFKPKDKEKNYSIGIFIELERSYASQERIDKKLQNYALAIRKNLYSNLLEEKIIAYRVLFVAQTQNQFDGLMDKIIESKAKMNDEEHFPAEILTVSYQDLVNAPLEPIYALPGSSKRFKLLSKLEG